MATTFPSSGNFVFFFLWVVKIPFGSLDIIAFSNQIRVSITSYTDPGHFIHDNQWSAYRRITMVP